MRGRAPPPALPGPSDADCGFARDNDTMSDPRPPRPPAADFAARPLRLQWRDELPRHWFGGNVFAAHLLNALSVTFPLGEKMFIDSVRAYRDRNADPQLDAEIAAFISQEGWHRSVHIGYNEWLTRLGFPVPELVARQATKIAFVQATVHPRGQLAITVCLEHFTAMLARQLLADPRRMAGMHAHFARIWRWHSLEELEHKAVAFDLFTATGGRYSTRVKAMVFVTGHFVVDIGRNLVALLRADGQLWRPLVWWQAIRFLAGAEPGLLWRALPGYLSFFRPRFHPSQHDDAALVRAAAERFDAPGVETVR